MASNSDYLLNTFSKYSEKENKFFRYAIDISLDFIYNSVIQGNQILGVVMQENVKECIENGKTALGI